MQLLAEDLLGYENQWVTACRGHHAQHSGSEQQVITFIVPGKSSLLF